MLVKINKIALKFGKKKNTHTHTQTQRKEEIGKIIDCKIVQQRSTICILTIIILN